MEHLRYFLVGIAAIVYGCGIITMATMAAGDWSGYSSAKFRIGASAVATFLTVHGLDLLVSSRTFRETTLVSFLVWIVVLLLYGLYRALMIVWRRIPYSWVRIMPDVAVVVLVIASLTGSYFIGRALLT